MLKSMERPGDEASLIALSVVPQTLEVLDNIAVTDASLRSRLYTE